MNEPVAIHHRDPHLVVVSKPAGLHVHRSEFSPDRDVLLTRVRDQLGQRVFPVHRLDRATSGLILLALSPESARAVQGLWSDPRTKKEYRALVRGEAAESFASDRPLTRRPDRVVQPASSSFRCIAIDRGFSLVAATLDTGRRHQIRRHLAHLGHQIVGDTTYGKGRINRWLREEFGLPRLFLHAGRLALDHPMTGERMEFVDPLPEDLAGFLERFSPILFAAP